MPVKTEVDAHVERSDYCAVPAAGVVGESLAALTLADAFLAKFGALRKISGKLVAIAVTRGAKSRLARPTTALAS